MHNPLRRIVAQTRKELTQLLRDPLAVALALGLPLLQLVLIGSALSLTVSDLPILIQDLDSSPASLRLADAFRASLTFRVVAWPPDRSPESALVASAARGALIIPPRFGRDLARGRAAPVQMLVDASDANTAKLIGAYAASVTAAFNATAAGPAGASGAAREPAGPGGGNGAGAPGVRPVVRLWYNPGLSSKKFFGPGIFVLAVSMFPPLLASLAMAKEGEQKTILQVYVSNISAHELLLGKIFSFMIVTFGECALLIGLLFTLFGVGFVGDPTPFLVATVLYAFCVSAFGTMVGAAIPNQLAAMQAVLLGGFLLVFMLSGLLYPVANIPVGLRWLSNFVWGRYYVEIVRDALLQGGGWPATWYKVLIIGASGTLFYTLGWRTMRRMQLPY
jgi:ABC-2 type transport system permease protein